MILQLTVTSTSQIKTLLQKIQMIPTFLMHQNNSACIHKANTNTETLLANQIYNTMILTIKTHLHSQINTPHYYKNYKIHIGAYTTQLQLKIIKFQKIWTLRLCHMQCSSPAIQTVTKINHIPYQTIVYNENGMFTTKLMNDTPVEIFIDNGATLSILPLHTYNKFPILNTYPKTESNTPIHTGRGLIKSHFWPEIPLKLDHQTIQIKALVSDSECPYDIILGQTSMAQLSAWQNYVSYKLYIQQISVPLTVRNNVRVLPGKTRVVSLTLQSNKSSFTPTHTITGKGVAYVKPFDSKLPLRPIEIEFENNCCCI